MPLCQIQAYKIHHGMGQDVHLSLAVALSTMQVTVRNLARFHSNCEGENTLYLKAFGNGPRHFEPWSQRGRHMNWHPTTPFPNFHTTPTGGHLSLDTAGLQQYQARNHDTTATAGSDVVQSGRPIFDDFFQHLWPYIGNNTANVVFQMVKRVWLIRIDQ
ncbi:hypothetical protein TNCV_534581 [Trichonephila clavipes]|nr:hypothetical protein TNCV_534581 [Trichonephila clavipes]